MKTTITILRSVATSLLFIILTFLIALQLVFTCLKVGTKDIHDLIDEESLLLNLADDSIEDEETEMLSKEYLEDYLNYVFYKRSYPSLQNVDYSNIEDSKKEDAAMTIKSLKEKLDIEYETIVNMRNANSFFSNGAIYLIINIGVLTLFIILCILRANFKSGLRLSSIALSLSSTVALIAYSIFKMNTKRFFTPTVKLIIDEIIGDPFSKRAYTISITYILIGLITVLLIYLYDYYIKMRLQKKTN